MGIDEIKPRQLAPSVGSEDADRAVVTVPSGAICDSLTTESHLLFGAFDFTAHSSATLKDFESVGDGLEMLFGSFCFQVGQTDTLCLPEWVPPPSIGPASWVPPIGALHASTLTNDLDDSSNCNSDMYGPPSDEATYGSRSESCGSSDPLRERYLCAVVINNMTKLPPGLSAQQTPNPLSTRRLRIEEMGEIHLTGPSKATLTPTTRSTSTRKAGAKHAKPWQATSSYQ